MEFSFKTNLIMMIRPLKFTILDIVFTIEW